MRLRRLVLLVTLVLLVIAVAACRKEEPATGTAVATVTEVEATPTATSIATTTIVLNDPDKQFVLDAAALLLAESDFARTADVHAKHVAVKAFAHLLVEDFVTLSAELKDLADKRHVSIPTVTDTVNAGKNTHLGTLTGKNFDEEFLKLVAADHVTMIALFDAEAKIVADADLKAWVAKTQPVLASHAAKAKELQDKIGKEKY
jgi:putative membrane protein